jgi:hypothetical protein
MNGVSPRFVPPKARGNASAIVSEKRTDIADDFTEVPAHHFVLVDSDLSVRMRAVKA